MISKEKIAIYNRFKGDIDAWARVGSKSQQSVMEDADWYMIDSLKQDTNLFEKGFASDDFVSALQKRLEENCDSKETISLLKEKEEIPGSFFNKLTSFFLGKK